MGCPAPHGRDGLRDVDQAGSVAVALLSLPQPQLAALLLPEGEEVALAGHQGAVIVSAGDLSDAVLER